MYLLDEVIECKSRSDRVEIFPLYDMHIDKRNCAEAAIRKQVREIQRRAALPNRFVRAVLGGDNINAINVADARRFDFAELADWLVVPTPQELARTTTSHEVADLIRAKLGNMINQAVERCVSVFEPIQEYMLGALHGGHEKTIKTRHNVDVHQALCDRLQITNLTDEAIIRIKFRRPGGSGTSINLYLRHGYGSGRTAGAEPNKLQRMLDEWEDMDVCLTGHTHTFCLLPPKPVLYIPSKGRLPKEPFIRYRFAANCGCWLLSHQPGASTYESLACYPARPMMTIKVVIWPFWTTHHNGKQVERPKIELRQYPIL